MSIPNIGPEHTDSGEFEAADPARRTNPAPVLRDEWVTDDVTAAAARASTVTHRFGGVRYALARPDVSTAAHAPRAEEGDSDASR